MSEQKKFNIGDRVRVVTDMEQPYYMWVEKGDAGVIVEGSPVKGFECVKIDGCANMDYVRVESKYLETDATYDPETAFLSDLADVLRKHNAVMDIAFWNKCVGIMITIPNEKLLLPISTEIAPASQTWLLGEYSHTPITADNIMDYDKE